MIRIDAPQEFTFGSPESETEREIHEPQRRVHLIHSFEISAHSVTVNQFRRFSPAFPYPTAVTFDLEAPCGDVRWYDAIQYCRWLSEQEGIAEDQMCYPPLGEIGPGMKLPQRWWERTGYRLPSEEEWECACRAGTETSRFFGDTAEDLTSYGWYMVNAEDELKPVGLLRPNPWGLFDVYGGVLEWTQQPIETFAASGTLRSGAYRSLARENRSAKRFVDYSLDKRLSYFGLRVARSRPR
jgi:formylglycine-generating enzyme required for sulfatase activity